MRAFLFALAMTFTGAAAADATAPLNSGAIAMVTPLGVLNQPCYDQLGNLYGYGGTAYATNGLVLTCQSGLWKPGELAELPPGALCGIQTGTGSAPCAGVYPAGGCPAGYYLMAWSEGNRGGIQTVYHCVKS